MRIIVAMARKRLTRGLLAKLRWVRAWELVREARGTRESWGKQRSVSSFWRQLDTWTHPFHYHQKAEDQHRHQVEMEIMSLRVSLKARHPNIRNIVCSIGNR